MAAEGDPDRFGRDAARDVRDAANVLLLTPGAGGASADCLGLDVLAPTDPGATRVLAVTYTGSADDWLARWRDRVGVPPAEVAVVNVGGVARSAAGPADAGGTDVPVEAVASPEDLTGLGITLGQRLSTWGADAPIVVCFDSLTALLQYADLQRAFRFLHVLTGRAAERGAHAHFHLDPSATDDRTVTTLATLFDAVVRHEDGEWSVRTR